MEIKKYTEQAWKINNFLSKFIEKNRKYLSSYRKPKMDKYSTLELKLVSKCIEFLGLENELMNVRINILRELCFRKFGKVDPTNLKVSILCN
jgi:preprotein translocase subunit Sss1